APAPRREAPPAPERPIVPRRGPAESSSIERALDDPDYATAFPPSAGARPPFASSPRPAPTRGDQGVPIGEDSVFMPSPFNRAPQPPAAPRSRARDGDTQNDTPHAFPGSDGEAKGVTDEILRSLVASAEAMYDPRNAGQTVMAGARPAAVGTRSILQFFHNSIGRWSDLGEVGSQGIVLGRSTFQAWNSNPESLAEEHLQLGFDGHELYVEPLETLNGVYRKLQPNHREELAPGARFRIGRHVLEFRLPPPPAEIVPLRSDEGEVFQSRVLEPVGFIDLIGPDGRPYLSFPMTRRDDRGTRIGRNGADCDVVLAGDEWVSHCHACVRIMNNTCWLEDLGSRNGTFLIIDGRIPLRRATAQYPAMGDEILVGGYKIRVLEERA
ncbi:MAG: FHA domain-containing protein, partial [Isosphaeraceae bacterium]